MSFFSNLVDSVNTAVDSVTHYSNDQLLQSIKVNGSQFRFVKLLGEGGFSFIYLAQDQHHKRYAVKIIKCTSKETTENAKREGILLSRFSHDNIIKIKDMCMIREEDGSKMLYIIMPFYKRGSIQDWIDNMKGEHLKEKELLSLFKQMCLGIRALVEYKDKGVSTPWAHRDVKPANVLLSDDGKTAVLMDFGSARKARIEIKDKRTAHQVQDEAAEHCSMPYRAPELFDVSAHNTIDEKIDIWSLGCTLYTMAYGESPFERTVVCIQLY
ncbi:unnamed protein product [Rhizopus stolonifer]